jgi:rod shape-determining protein MreD
MQTNITSKLIIITLFSLLLGTINLGSIWQQIQPFWLFALYFIVLIKYQLSFALYLAVVLGLMLDITFGSILGQNSLAFVVSSYLVLNNLKQIKFANTPTKLVYLLIISLVYLLVLLIPQVMIQGFDINYLIFISPITTTIFFLIINTFWQHKF